MRTIYLGWKMLNHHEQPAGHLTLWLPLRVRSLSFSSSHLSHHLHCAALGWQHERWPNAPKAAPNAPPKDAQTNSPPA